MRHYDVKLVLGKIYQAIPFDNLVSIFKSKKNSKGTKNYFSPRENLGLIVLTLQTTKQLKAIITKERASRLEGSFGKEKKHYYLKKIKAKTKANEILWIFFGIHTANCLEIDRRM